MSQQIQAFDFSVDLLRALLWQYNDAARLEALLRQKQEWYDANQTAFWRDWTRDVFDLRTANDFGLAVWAIILNVPLAAASQGDDPNKPIWGFGQYRENFTNGNFASISSSQLSTEQKRLVLRLRYFQLVTRGTVPEVNSFLRYLFGDMGGPALAPGVYAQYTPSQVARCIRATPAYFVTSTKSLEVAPADTPRFSASGLIVEAAATNIFTYSSQIDAAAWVKTGEAVATDGTLSPNKNEGAAKLIEDVTNGVHRIAQSPHVTSGNVYSSSIYAKKRERSVIQMLLSRTHFGDNVYANFDLDAGTVGTFGSDCLPSIEALADEWYRCALTATAISSGSAPFVTDTQLTPTAGRGDTHVGDGVSGVYLWGAQAEQGGVSSLITTVSAGASRAADEIHITSPSALPKAYVNDGYDMTARYVFNFPLSSALEMVLSEYDLLPRPAGVKIYYVVIGDADGWGFGRYHENFTNGNFNHA